VEKPLTIVKSPQRRVKAINAPNELKQAMFEQHLNKSNTFVETFFRRQANMASNVKHIDA